MINIVITVVIITTFWHFIYEAIIAPSIRTHLRYDYFKLRDKLRNLKIENPHELDDLLFSNMENTINFSIKYMAFNNIFNIIKLRRAYNSDPLMRKETDKRISMVQNCKLQELKEVDIELSKLNGKVFLTNCGAIMLYFPPLLLLTLPFLFFKYCLKSIQKIAYSPKTNIGYYPNYHNSGDLAY